MKCPFSAGKFGRTAVVAGILLASLFAATRGAAQNLPVTNVLSATRHWDLKPVLKEFGDDALRLHAGKIHGGKLWLALRDTGRRLYYPPPPPRWVIRALEPATLATAKTFTGDFEKDSQLNGSFFDVHGDYLYVVLGPYKLRQIDLRTSAVKDIPVLLPNNSAIHVIAHNSGVFIGSADRLLHIHAKTSKLTILASLRRRPAANELDNGGWGMFSVLDDQEESAAFLFRTMHHYSIGKLDLRTMQWQLGDKQKIEGKLLLAGENGRGDTDGDRYHLTTIMKDLTIKPLLNGMSEDSAWWKLSQAMPATHGHPSLSTLSFDGKRLWMLFPPRRWKASTLPTDDITEAVPGTDAILSCYDDRWLLPVEIPLRMPPGLSRFDAFCRPLLIAGAEGLLILEREETDLKPEFVSFWYISSADINAWLAANESAQQLPTRGADPLRAKHDKNRNGLLEPEELEAFKTDPEYLARERKTAAQAFVKAHDRNGNNGIEQDELPMMDRFLFVKKGNGAGALHPTDLYHIADKNKDRSLDADELNWLHAPDFDYEKIRRTPTLPPSLQKFDVNKNGKLDPEEAAAVKKHAEQMKR